MEHQESEEPLSVKECLLQLLDNVSDIGGVIKKKSNTILQELVKINDEDVNSIEAKGLRLIKMIQTLYINVTDITNTLEMHLMKFNENRTEKLFEDLYSIILDYKKISMPDIMSHSNVTLNKVVSSDKNTQTDFHNNSAINSIHEIKSEVECDVKLEMNDSIAINSSIKNVNLGLIRTDTQDTEDCWIDSITRSPTAVELHNRNYQRGKITDAGKFLDDLKAEQTEENAWDKDTEDLNYESDRHLSSDDDTFVDGKSLKSEETFEEPVEEPNTENNADITLKLEEPVEEPNTENNADITLKLDGSNVDDNKDINCESDTTLSKHSDLSDEGEKDNINNLDIKNTSKSILNSKENIPLEIVNNKSEANHTIRKVCENQAIDKSLNTDNIYQNKTVSGCVNEIENKLNQNKNIECSAHTSSSLDMMLNETTISEQNVCSSSTENQIIRNTEQNIDINTEQSETKSSNSASLSTLDEDFSTQLITLAEHWEAVDLLTVTENNSRNKLPLSNNDQQLSETRDFDESKKENNSENALLQSNDHDKKDPKENDEKNISLNQLLDSQDHQLIEKNSLTEDQDDNNSQNALLDSNNDQQLPIKKCHDQLFDSHGKQVSDKNLDGNHEKNITQDALLDSKYHELSDKKLEENRNNHNNQLSEKNNSFSGSDNDQQLTEKENINGSGKENVSHNQLLELDDQQLSEETDFVKDKEENNSQTQLSNSYNDQLPNDLDENCEGNSQNSLLDSFNDQQVTDSDLGGINEANNSQNEVPDSVKNPESNPDHNQEENNSKYALSHSNLKELKSDKKNFGENSEENNSQMQLSDSKIDQQLLDKRCVDENEGINIENKLLPEKENIDESREMVKLDDQLLPKRKDKNSEKSNLPIQLPLEDLALSSEETSESGSDKISSKITYSQETVKLNLNFNKTESDFELDNMPDADEFNVVKDSSDLTLSPFSVQSIDYSENTKQETRFSKDDNNTNETSSENSNIPVGNTYSPERSKGNVDDDGTPDLFTEEDYCTPNSNFDNSIEEKKQSSSGSKTDTVEETNELILDINKPGTFNITATEADELTSVKRSQTFNGSNPSSEKMVDNSDLREYFEVTKDDTSILSTSTVGNNETLSQQIDGNPSEEFNEQSNLDSDFIATEISIEQKALKNSIEEEKIIEAGSEKDCANSTKKLNTEEECSSRSSSQSVVFNISDNHYDIDHLENKTNTSPASDRKNHSATGELIEISSDSDDEVHLDVTMEEIITNGSSAVVEHKEKTTVKIEEAPENATQINVTESTNPQNIGDELLELLREVEVPAAESVRECERIKHKRELKEADEIYKMLQEGYGSHLSDSETCDSDVDVSCSDLEELIEDKPKEEHKIDSKITKKPLDINDLLTKFNMRECYVSIEKLHLDANEVVKVNENLNDSIDRLCDISTIVHKRKHKDAHGYSNTKRKAMRTQKGTSDSESLSSFSSSDSDNALHDNPTHLTNFNEPLIQKIDDMLANEIYNGLRNNSSNESTDVESDISKKSLKQLKNGNNEKTLSGDVKKKRLLSKEERQKKSWKNDPLLRGKLTSDESSDSSTSDSEKSSKRRSALRSKYEHDTDFNITSHGSDCDSDNSLNMKNIQLTNNVISPIKRNILITDSSTDSDSDVEIIIHKQTPPKKEPNMEEEEAGPSSSQKGRRNIRALMSDESLAEATQRANKEEHERIERLEGRHKIKEIFSQSLSQPMDEDTFILDVDEVTGEPLIKVHPKLNTRLKPHQKDGVQFMWDSCYESLKRLKVDQGSGCILAHCMGLGKTFQVLTLLHTLFSYEETNTEHVLVVCPTSTVNNWKKEVKIAFKNFTNDKLNMMTIIDKREVSQKYSIVKKWYSRKKCILVMGYECFESLINEGKLEKLGDPLKTSLLEALIDPGPDLVICDEGHLLRNRKALKTLALNKISTKRRIVLTGTPLQNNLLEYYYMVNFVKPNLLGNIKEYKTNFVNPITNGQYEDSTAEDIKLMMKRTHVLHKLLKKTIQRVEDSELKIYLPKMVDHAVFVQLHQVQVDLYNKFSKLVKKNSENTNRKGFLSDFCIFQYICTHPQLLAVMENLRNKKIKERDLITNEQEDKPICNIEGWWKALLPPDASEKIEYGNKLMVLKSIIEECEQIGDKVLVFSQSLGELDLIEHFLQKQGTLKCPSWEKRVDYSRMDGTIPPGLRSTICDLFNDKDNKKLRLLLMSTKVGGLGLNLTAANRVIIMTVNWNPSYDIQSVFRVYRFGQEKNVYVYRLIALDSMEEKVYQRTVTKLAIAHRVVDKHQITRHYKSMDLQELYSCEPTADIERPISNVPEDKVLAKLILKLPCIFKHHEHQALLANRPEDNLNEQELNAAWDEFKRIKDAPHIPLNVQLPQQTSVPQIPHLVNGPTFSMAYDLIRSTMSATNNQKLGTTQNGATQNFIPQPREPVPEYNKLTKKIRLATSRILNKIPKLPNDTTMSLANREGSVPTPILKNNTISLEEDPLFIPLEIGNNNKTYSEMLSKINQQLSIPKLPPDTVIDLERTAERGKQKPNSHNKNIIGVEDGSINILDDETPSSSSKNPGQFTIPKLPPNTVIDLERTAERGKQKPNSQNKNIIGVEYGSINILDDETPSSSSKNPRQFTIPKLPPNTVIDLERTAERGKQKPNSQSKNIIGVEYGSINILDDETPSSSSKNPRQFTIPKLPPNTSIRLERLINRSKQKENSRDKNYPVEVATSVSKKNDQPNPLVKHDSGVKAKRKRTTEDEGQNFLKKLRNGVKSNMMPLATINLDDDDLVITDSMSESGSLSSELLNNLGRSGITIQKVMKDAKKANATKAYFDLTGGD